MNDGSESASCRTLADHLSQPAFDGCGYQSRAKDLAAQLKMRAEDFKSFRLPAPEEWKSIQSKTSRADQVRFLAERLRLLNCIQIGQPADVNYDDPQFAKAEDNRRLWYEADVRGTVVNPYVELKRLQLSGLGIANPRTVPGRH